MAVDPAAMPVPAPAPTGAPPPMTAATQAALVQAATTPQLTQARAPLDEAAAAFAKPNEAGHFPVVVLPDRARRTRVDFIAGGIIAIVAALFIEIDIVLKAAIVAGGVLAIVAGLFRAFIVPVPMGSQAVLLRAGKFYKTVGPGTHFVLPMLPVSHIVATREIPFGAPALNVPTADDVRTNLDMVMTFTIESPEKFVFAITAPDFDEVCQATCQQSLRQLVRAKTAADVIDMGDGDTAKLRQEISEVLTAYGVNVKRVVITHVSLPVDFIASREAQGLAAFQRAEEQEQHTLELLRQNDRMERNRRKIAAEREQIELEAANEVTRLERLQKRLQDYPEALEWDVQSQRLEVAKALASNTRAMVQVGPADDITTALLMHTATDDVKPPANGPERSRNQKARSAEG